MSATFKDVLKIAEIIAVETRCRYTRGSTPRGDLVAQAQKCIALRDTPTQDKCFCRDAATAVMRHLNPRIRS